MDHTAPSISGDRMPVGRLVGVDRVLAVLVELARHPNGVGLEDLARAVDSPKPTVHRALASLRRARFAAKDARGHYVLGDDFLRLAFAHHEARPDEVRIRPVLQALAERFGETAHYAVLDGSSVVYRSKVDPLGGAVRLTSTVGGRNPAHSTAVGKLLLAYVLPDEVAVKTWIGGRQLERRTARTKTTPRELGAEFQIIRQQRFSVDDQENEPGVVCVAVPVFLTSAIAPSGAVSVSAPAYRTALTTLVGQVEAIRAAVSSSAFAAAM